MIEERIDGSAARRILETLAKINHVLKILNFDDKVSDPQIEPLLKEREKARQEQNWALADQVREQLQARGVWIKDGKVRR